MNSRRTQQFLAAWRQRIFLAQRRLQSKAWYRAFLRLSNIQKIGLVVGAVALIIALPVSLSLVFTAQELRQQASGGGCDNGVPVGGTACQSQGDSVQYRCGPGSNPGASNWITEPCAGGSTCQGTACTAGASSGGSSSGNQGGSSSGGGSSNSNVCFDGPPSSPGCYNKTFGSLCLDGHTCQRGQQQSNGQFACGCVPLSGGGGNTEGAPGGQDNRPDPTTQICTFSGATECRGDDTYVCDRPGQPYRLDPNNDTCRNSAPILGDCCLNGETVRIDIRACSNQGGIPGQCPKVAGNCSSPLGEIPDGEARRTECRSDNIRTVLSCANGVITSRGESCGGSNTRASCSYTIQDQDIEIEDGDSVLGNCSGSGERTRYICDNGTINTFITRDGCTTSTVSTCSFTEDGRNFNLSLGETVYGACLDPENIQQIYICGAGGDLQIEYRPCPTTSNSNGECKFQINAVTQTLSNGQIYNGNCTNNQRNVYICTEGEIARYTEACTPESSCNPDTTCCESKAESDGFCYGVVPKQ